jgi:hypothetical protein
MLWNASEEYGNVSVRKIKALMVKMKTATPTGKGRQNLTNFVY